MEYTLQKSGLNVRKGRGKNKYAVYKYSTPLFTGIEGKELAEEMMMRLYEREKELRE
jgi:hypothetical protein